ncbi:MAG: PQQ-binding-like beta-propeller repeat protein [Planctomycetes bacterium]|nr:PQQ-binding-like beta-propeller repeat protein [Planctomycetota bacterium]
MRLSPIAVLVTLLLATAAVTATWSWLRAGAGRAFALREPFPVEDLPRFRAELPGVLTTGAGRAAEDLEGSWPCFRGPDWDGVSWGEVRLAEQWPADGPRRLWQIDVGEGYAGAAIHRGRVYVLDYDEGRVGDEVVPERRGDVLRCLSLRDGAEIWRRWYHLPMVRQHGITRTVPAVTDRHVVSLGPMGHVLCLDAVTGDAKWSLDLVEEFGAVIPEWYAAQCPRIDDRDGQDVAILAPGGDRDVLMLAVVCETGEVRWRTPNPKSLQMTHSSIAWMDWHGEDTYVYCTTGGVVGVAADDGRLLWEFPEWVISPAVVPTPVVMPGNRILLSGGYKAGSVLLELRDGERGEPTPAVVARLDVRTFGAEQQTPIAYENCIYGVLTKDAGPLREQLTCLSVAGAVLWSSGPERRFELGPFLVADGKLLLMDDNGVLTMARHSTTGYEELASARVLDGHESWGPMALAGGLLVARDLHTMVCLDLREGALK